MCEWEGLCCAGDRQGLPMRMRTPPCARSPPASHLRPASGHAHYPLGATNTKGWVKPWGSVPCLSHRCPFTATGELSCDSLKTPCLWIRSKDGGLFMFLKR